ncbi:MAG: tetratricopeptide repeat protein [Syntrophales bacterium]|nr:tetratricopeptide repeat protein [Syntrophales bacterium]
MRTQYLCTFIAVILMSMSCYSCVSPPKHTGIQPRTQFAKDVASVKGPSLYKEGKYQEALPHLQRWVQTDPTNWISHNWLGNNYLQLKRYDEAIAELQKANAIKKDSGNFNGLGQCYYHKGLYDEALGYFRMWVELDNTNWISHHWLGCNYLQLKRYDEAIAELQKANAIKKDSVNFRALGQCYYKLGKYDHAIELLERGLNISPDLQKRDFKFELAMCYLAKGDDGKASQLLEGRQILGVQIQKHEKGFNIVDMHKNAPADRAGLKRGDILTEFNGKSLSEIDIKKFIEELIPNTDEADVKFLRQDRIHAATIQMNLRLVKRVEPKTIIIERPGFAGEKWAVIIGVSQYKDSRIPCLRYASKDAQSLYNWLISQNGGRYSPSRVKLLTDESATTRNIKNALFGWLKQAIAEDMVIIYFAGHGSPPSPDEPENLFLLSYDTDFDMISSTGFPMWDVETALKRFIKAERVVVIADACHAGGVGSAFIQGTRAINIKPTTATALQSLSNAGKGIAVITASDDKQLSQEGKQWGGGHGVFTYHLLNGLKGEADYNNDNLVTLGELIPYLSQSVRRATKNAQSPTVAGRFDPAITLKK